MRSHKYFTIELGALFWVSVFLFTVGLASQEIISFDSRFYLFALEMWRHGPTWFPTTYREPYPDYPGTSTFLIYLAAKLFGHLNKFTAVLPSALAAGVTVVVTYAIGRQTSRASGLAAVFFLFFTLTFIVEARTISLDQYVTAVTALCFYVVYFNKPRWWILFFLLIGFAFRGPLGLVIPAGVVSVLYLMDGEWKRFFIFGFSALLILVLATMALMMLAYHVGDYLFLQDVFRMQVVGRLHDPHSPPNYYYFRDCISGYFVTYPLLLFLVWGYLKEDKFRKLIAWALIILIGLSLPSDKKMRYILPFAPALALMCSYLFYEVQNRYTNFLRKVFFVVCYLFPLIAIGVVFYIKTKLPQFALQCNSLILLFCLLQLANLVLRKNALAMLGIAALSFYLGNIFLIEKITLQKNATRDFVLQTETLRKAYHSPLVFFQEGPDGLPIKYLVDMPRETKPVFLYDASELLKLKSNTVVIVGEDNFAHLPKATLQNFTVVTHNQIGHDPVVLLQKD